ncbi:MAG: beta-hydroxyacyl-ACP dehydratase [Myxococcales bacterium]|nr:beta-hydroxyacyl-ACP dehydratase [Myxococcales bacterium]
MIESLIPHRGRWRLVDRIVEHDDNSVVTEFHFTEDFVEGHFPEQLVVPGVALVEGLAQTMLVLSRLLEPDAEGITFLAGLDRVRFRAPVMPPATVRFHVKVVGRRGQLTTTSGTASWEGKRVCTAKLTGAIIERP